MHKNRFADWVNVLLQGKQLVAADKHLVTGLEGCGDDTLLGLDGEVDLVDRTQDLVDLANGGLLCDVSLRKCDSIGISHFAIAYLVLQIDRSVEVGDLRVDRLADHLALTSVHHRSHLYQNISTASHGPQGFDCIYRELAPGDRTTAGSLRGLDQKKISLASPSRLSQHRWAIHSPPRLPKPPRFAPVA